MESAVILRENNRSGQKPEFFLIIFFILCVSICFSFIPDFLFPFAFVLMFLFLLVLKAVFNFKFFVVLKFMLFSFFLLWLCSILRLILPYFIALEIHCALFFLALFFVHTKIEHILIENLNTPKKILHTIFHAIGLCTLSIILLLSLSFALYFLGFQSDSIQIYKKISELPIYLLILAVFFAPLSEELFFRAFLAPRFGAPLSALLFSLAHILYNSVFELIGSFLIGLVFAFYFLKTKNIASLILAHSFFNLISLVFILLIKCTAPT